jgi:alpha-L-rhamnosidase
MNANESNSICKSWMIIPFVMWFMGSSLYAKPEDLSQVWPAFWVEPASGTSIDYAVSYFRKSFDLYRVPDTLKVHTTGNQIYQLFVNGQSATRGPQTGDLRHWHYETTDIAPFLQPGKNEK